MTRETDAKTRDFLGLPLFHRLYGFGDRLTLRAKMVTAVFTKVDRAALAGALPVHPRVKLHPRSPLLLIQSDFVHCADNGDPQGNDYRYREVMLACVLQGEGVGTLFGPMFPLVLFLDDPVATAAGREFQGFPKVLASLEYGEASGRVDFTSYPRGHKTSRRVLSTQWDAKPGLVARALAAAGGAVASAVRASGIDEDTVDAVVQLALAPSGETWNLHQVPDLANPRRAAYSRLTRFKPVVVDPSDLALLSGFALDLPSAADEPTWMLGRRFFGAKDDAVVRHAAMAFRWEATMYASGGEVIDAWQG
jgi:hypothetical protein